MMMIAQRTLTLEFAEGRLVPVTIRRESVDRSRHTGRELAQLHGIASTAEEEAHRAISTLLREIGERPVGATDDQGEHAGRWCISWNAYAESNGVHTYTLLLREVEELTLEVLLVNDLELRPYEYSETIVGEGLVVRAKMVGTRDDVVKIRELVRSRRTLHVVRSGIQEEPREMRVGVGEWSDSEDGIKYRLVLVDRALDRRTRPELQRIEEENGRAALGFYATHLDQLSELLVRKGVLTRDELEALRDASGLATGVARRDLWRVADVDEV